MFISLEEREVIKVQRIKVVVNLSICQFSVQVDILGYRNKTSTYTGYVNDEKYVSVGGICRYHRRRNL
jgi:hypothetical protein